MGITNPSAQEVRDALRDYKVDFQTIGNWDTVGNAWNATGGGLYGCIMHHTGANISGYSGAPALTWMRTAYDKPACNILVGRGKGDTYLLSALAVYHSGLGGPWPAIGLNSAGYGAEARTFGVEIEGSTAYGNVPESRPYFTEYQEENAARIAAALWDLCGWPADGSRIVTHGDWTDSGKYLGTNNYGPYLGRKPDTRRSTHSGKYWRKMAAKYLDPSKEGSEPPSTPNPNNGDNKGSDNKTDDNVVDLARQVKPNAVAKSVVAGTPQRARFALMNMANESVYLSEGETSVLSGSGEGILWVKARTVVDGESYEVSRNIQDKSGNGNVTIETNWIQNDSSANAALALITDSFDFKFKSVTAQIFGNPLIQIGDLVKLTYDTGKISFDESKYYMVTKVSHTFDLGLSTTVRLSPVNKVS
jgi:hypothetical protein